MKVFYVYFILSYDFSSRSLLKVMVEVFNFKWVVINSPVKKYINPCQVSGTVYTTCKELIWLNYSYPKAAWEQLLASLTFLEFCIEI